ncbi:MAG: TetR family transcriptional regulator [Nocardioides sp.]|nr:TetR family transcriptional regulator [Nocardioides sp.]
MSGGSTTLRDVTRQAVRDQVVNQAWQLFARHGFEGTTIDQIAEASGMSRRTFFRYFTGKDELIVEKLVEAGERVADALAERPAGEPAWAAVRAAFNAVVDAVEAHPEHSRKLRIMLRDEPVVRSSLEEWRRRWVDLLAPLIASRLGASAGDVRVEAMAGSALACLDAAQVAWADHPGSDLGALLDAAMGALAPV